MQLKPKIGQAQLEYIATQRCTQNLSANNRYDGALANQREGQEAENTKLHICTRTSSTLCSSAVVRTKIHGSSKYFVFRLDY